MDLQTLLHKDNLDRADLIALLGLTDPEDRKALYDAAYAVKSASVGRVAYYRGLLEFSNRCIKTASTAVSAGTMRKWNGSTPPGRTSWPWPGGLWTTSTGP